MPVYDSSSMSYFALVRALIEFEGRRCLWRVLLGVACLLSTAVIFIAGPWAAIYLADDLARGLRLLLALGPSSLVVAAIRSRRPWRAVVETRLASYAVPNPLDTDENTLIRADDHAAAASALRRARLNPYASVRLGRPPGDAPELNVRLVVCRPAAWPSTAGKSLVDDMAGTLSEAGISARVAGRDVGPALTARRNASVGDQLASMPPA